ncbi:MAG TPA: hypothetical protein VN181_03420, partial [Thermoanaerobaculia bacterium]|nr:hypothetical protein [Thermoanaerobaculia bacterium]
VNYIDMIKLTWHAQRDAFDRVQSEAFLGTQSVLIERALTCVAESIREVYRAMDSVFIGAIERSTLTIKLGESDDVAILITVAELLDWIEDVATVRGFDIIRESGKDGVIHALAPTLVRLVEMLKGLIAFIQADAEANADRTLPQALSSNRVMNALTELLSHLKNTTAFAGGIQRYPAPTVTSTVPTVLIANRLNSLQIFGSNFDQDADVSLEFADREAIPPTSSVWRDSSQIDVKLDVPAGIEGTWSLRVRNENGAEASFPITIRVN